MKIAVVHSFYSAAEPSGENSAVLDQVDALLSAGHDVRLLARATDDVRSQLGYSLRSGITVLTGVGPSPSNALKEFEPDVVHLHNTFPNWGTSWINYWRGRTVVTVHNFRPVCAAGTLFRDGHPCFECLRRPVLPALRHRCYRDSALITLPLAVASAPRGSLRSVLGRVARVLVLNEDAKHLYQGMLSRPVNVVPNFVPPPKSTMDSGAGWAFVGRLTEEKGISWLVDNWPQGSRLDVLGDGPLRSEIVRMAEERPGVRVLGLFPREDLLDRLSGYAGVILPSLWAEGLPTVILEAMARGVPSVVSDKVASASSLRSLGVAATFRPDFPTSLRAALDWVVAGGPELRRHVRTVHDLEYSPRAWVERVLPIYQDVGRRADGQG